MNRNFTGHFADHFAIQSLHLVHYQRLSDGVTVAQGPLEAFVLVRIQVGQPILPGERDENELSLADSAQNSAESESKSARFPKIIRHRKSQATIYGKSKRYPFYRVVYRACLLYTSRCV